MCVSTGEAGRVDQKLHLMPGRAPGRRDKVKGPSSQISYYSFDSSICPLLRICRKVLEVSLAPLAVSQMLIFFMGHVYPLKETVLRNI